MNTRARIFSCLLLGLAAAFISCSSGEARFEKAVAASVTRQMDEFPCSTLKDLYKSYFQDRFGPGHIISDSTVAGAYLRSELASDIDKKCAALEAVGWEGNFYRVNLSVVKSGELSYSEYFAAFLRSASSAKPVAIEDWIEEWHRIEPIIKDLYPDLPGYSADSLQIETNLSKGIYMGHHSDSFIEAYDPHYRIVSKEECERLGLLK